MSGWLVDTSANKFKNTYIQDVNDTNFALDISGGVTIRSDHNLQFENEKFGTYIGKDISSNLLEGKTNIVVGNNHVLDRLKQWDTIDHGSLNSFNSVAYGNNKFVTAGQETLKYSTDYGYNWVDGKSNLQYVSYNQGFKKIRLQNEGLSNNKTFNKVRIIKDKMNNVNSYNVDNNFGITELQTWVIDPNDSTLKNYSQEKRLSIDSTHYGQHTLENYNVVNGVIPPFPSGNGVEGGYLNKFGPYTKDIGTYWTITFSENVKIGDLAAIVYYNDYYNTSRSLGNLVQLMQDDEIVYSEEVSREQYMYRLDGPKLTTLSADKFTINDSNTLIKNVDAIQVITGLENSARIGVIRLQQNGTFTNVMDGHEIQIWAMVDGVLTNVALSGTGKLSTTYGSDWNTTIWEADHINDGNIKEVSGGMFHTSNASNGYVQITLESVLLFQNLVSIVVYGRSSGRLTKGVAMQLLDFDNNSVLYDFDMDLYLVDFRFDGPAISQIPSTSFSQGSLTHNFSQGSLTHNNQVINRSLTKILIPNNRSERLELFQNIQIDEVQLWMKDIGNILENSNGLQTKNRLLSLKKNQPMKFNRIRIRRTSNSGSWEANSDNAANIFTVRELQVWKYNNGTIENVALHGYAHAETSQNPNHGPATCIINELFNATGTNIWYSDYEANTELGHYIELTLKDYVYIEDLASVVWYWEYDTTTGSYEHRKNGMTISLHDQNEEIFSREIIGTTPLPNQFRIDGPAITKTQKFSAFYSATHIIDNLRLDNVGTTILGNISDYMLESVKSVDCYFNKVRIVKNSWSLNFGLRQLQIWVNTELEGLKNVALSTNGGFANASSIRVDTADTNGISTIIDNIIGYNNAEVWFSDDVNDYNPFVTVQTLENHKISDLASIVIYNRTMNTTTLGYLVGCSVQLMYNDVILYSKEIRDPLDYFRLDGPYLSQVPPSMFSIADSTTAIKQDIEPITMASTVNGKTFSKVRVIRTGHASTQLNVATDSGFFNIIIIEELQLWMKINGTYQNILLNNVGTISDTGTTGTDPARATNGLFKTSPTNWDNTYYTSHGNNDDAIGENIYWDVSASNVSDIGSLIYYTQNNGSTPDTGTSLGRIIGVSVQLLDASDNIIFTHEIEKIQEVHRFDGPAITDIPLENFTLDSSANSIISSTKVVPSTFNKIRLTRTTPHTAAAQNKKHITFDEVQLFTRDPSANTFQDIASNAYANGTTQVLWNNGDFAIAGQTMTFTDISLNDIHIDYAVFVNNVGTDFTPAWIVKGGTSENPTFIFCIIDGAYHKMVKIEFEEPSPNVFRIKSAYQRAYNTSDVNNRHRATNSQISTWWNEGFGDIIAKTSYTDSVYGVRNLVISRGDVRWTANSVNEYTDRYLPRALGDGYISGTKIFTGSGDQVEQYEQHNNRFATNAQAAYSDLSDGTHYVEKIVDETSLENMASIVIYGYTGDLTYSLGVSVQLLHNDIILYSEEIVTEQRYHRFDGPAINLSPYNLFSYYDATNNVVNETSDYALTTMATESMPIRETNTFGNKFNKLRLIRTNLVGTTTDSMYHKINIAELQVWVNNVNILSQIPQIQKYTFTTNDDNPYDDNQPAQNYRAPDNTVGWMDRDDTTHPGIRYYTGIMNNVVGRRNVAIELQTGSAGTGSSSQYLDIEFYTKDDVQIEAREKNALNTNPTMTHTFADEFAVATKYRKVYTLSGDYSEIKVKLYKASGTDGIVIAVLNIYFENDSISASEPTVDTVEYYVKENVIDGNIMSANYIGTFLTTAYNNRYISSTSYIGTFLQVEFPEKSLDNLQSVLYYNFADNHPFAARARGVSVQLMYNDTVIYTYEIAKVQEIYRFDGPAMNQVPKSLLTTKLHPKKIHDTSEHIIANTTSPTATFDKLRVIRTSLSGLTTALGNENRLGVREIQLWAGGQNLLQNVVGTVSSTLGAPTFNIVRLTRTRFMSSPFGSNDAAGNWIIFKELELYINGENVALTSNGGTASTNDTVWYGWDASRINDGNMNNYYHSDADGGPYIDVYVQIELQNSHNINDLQSVIIYPRDDEDTQRDISRMDGVSLSLYNDTTLVYNYEITSPSSRYRLDGPSYTSESLTNYNSFRKVRIVSATNHGSDGWSNQINLNEIQLWIGNVNLCRDSNTVITFTGTNPNPTYPLVNAHDGDPGGSSHASAFFSSVGEFSTVLGDYVQVELNQNHSLSELQSFVIYKFGGYFGILGKQVQFLNDKEQVIYSYEIESGQDVSRFDGPGISSYTLEYSTVNSAHFIYDVTPLDNITNMAMDLFTKFTKVRIKRTANSSVWDGTSNMSGYNIIVIRELQVWINNVNVLLNANTFLSSNAGELNSSYVKENACDGDLNTTYTSASVAVSPPNATETKINDYIEFHINPQNISDIQSLVYYGRASFEETNNGLSIQLLNAANQLLYTHEIQDKQSVYRFDGPAISSVTSFSTENSTTLIKDVTPTSTIMSPSLPFTEGMATFGNFGPENATNGVFDDSDGSQFWGWLSSDFDGASGIGQHIILDCSNTTINDVESIVLYNYPEDLPSSDSFNPNVRSRMRGVSIELLNSAANNEIVYSYEIQHPQEYYRLEGPAMSQVSLERLTIEDSSANIKHFVEPVTYAFQNPSQQFKKIRIISRTDPSPDDGDVYSKSIQIKEMQLWIGNQNYCNDTNANISGVFANGINDTSHPLTNAYDDNLDYDNYFINSLDNNVSTNPPLLGDYIEINLKFAQPFSSLQSFILFPRHANRQRLSGKEIQFLKSDDTLLYAHEIVSQNEFYRFDGPGITSTNLGFTLDDSANSIKTETVMPMISSNSFDKMRIIRTSLTTKGNQNNPFNILETQIWVNDVNVAPSFTAINIGTDYYKSTGGNPYLPSNAIYGTIDSTYYYNTNTIYVTGAIGNNNIHENGHLLISSDISYNINDLQAVTVYSDSGASYNIETDVGLSYYIVDNSNTRGVDGVSLQLIDSSFNIVYTHEIANTNRYNRFDGPSIDSVPYNMFTYDDSGNSIKTIPNVAIVADRFNKVRIIRTVASPTGIDGTGHFTFYELQIWCMVNGIVTNVALNGTANHNTGDTTRGDPNNIINEIFEGNDNATKYGSGYISFDQTNPFYVELTLPSDILISDLVSCSTIEYQDWMVGTSLQFIHNNTIVYSHEIRNNKANQQSSRFDGPSFIKTPQNLMVLDASTNAIQYEKILPVNKTNSGLLFKKIKLQRLQQHSISGSDNYMSYREIQVWVHRNGVTSNVAYNQNATSSGSYSNGRGPEKAVNGIIHPNSDQQDSWESSGELIGENIQVEFDQNYGFNELASVVIYSHAYNQINIDRNIGVAVQLLDENDEILYSYIIKEAKAYYILDGPMRSAVDPNMIDWTDASGTIKSNIIEVYDNQNSGLTTFNTVRIERTHTSVDSNDRIEIRELQVWKNNNTLVNIALDGSTFASRAEHTTAVTSSTDDDYNVHHLNDNSLFKFDHPDGNVYSYGYISTDGTSNIGDFAELRLSEYCNISELASIVMYTGGGGVKRYDGANPTQSSPIIHPLTAYEWGLNNNRSDGLTISLYNNATPVYIAPQTLLRGIDNMVFRYNGPAAIPRNRLSSRDPAFHIFDIYEPIDSSGGVLPSITENNATNYAESLNNGALTAISSGTTFNRLQLVKPECRYFYCRQIQIWGLDSSNNLVNFASQLSGGTTTDDTVNGWLGMSDLVEINDEVLGELYKTSDYKSKLDIKINLKSELDLSKLVCVVLYPVVHFDAQNWNDTNGSHVHPTIGELYMNLLNNKNHVLQVHISESMVEQSFNNSYGQHFMRFDGPAMSQTYSNMFTYNDSESRIKLHGSQLNYPILPLEPASNFNAKKFNKIRVIRTSLNTFTQNASGNVNQYMHVRELQVWIYKDNLLTNVAINKPTVATSLYPNPGYEPKNSNNGLIPNGTYGTGKVWLSWDSETKIGDNLIIEIGEYDLSDLATIVFYDSARTTGWVAHNCNPGVSIQLLHDSKVIYSEEIQHLSDPHFFYRFDGPAIGQVPEQFFSLEDSCHKIKGFAEKTKGTDTCSLQNISSQVTDGSFNVVRLIKKNQAHTGSPWNINFKELQIWINNTNVAYDASASASHPHNDTASNGNYSPDYGINNLLGTDQYGNPNQIYEFHDKTGGSTNEGNVISNYWQVEIPTQNISDIQSIVKYGNQGWPYASQGTALQIINTEDTATTNATFSKVRVIRTNDNPDGSANNWLNFYELQVWVNGTNIAFNAPTKSNDTGYGHSEYRWHSSRAVNGVISESGLWHSDVNIGDEITISLTETLVSNLQSVVLYNRTSSDSTKKRIKGVSVQLLDASDNVMYTSEISNGLSVYRFDGPATIPTELLDTSISTTHIYNGTDLDTKVISTISNVLYSDEIQDVARQYTVQGSAYSTIPNSLKTVVPDAYKIIVDNYDSDYFNYIHDLSFNKVKLLRTNGNSTTVTNYTTNLIELQVWSKNVNLASSKNGGILDTNMIYYIHLANGGRLVGNLTDEILSSTGDGDYYENASDDNNIGAVFHSHHYNTTVGLGTYIEVQVESIKVSDLQSIVLYNRVGTYGYRTQGLSVQLIREKNLSVFDNITFNKVKIKRTRPVLDNSNNNNKYYIRILEFQIWMYDGVDISNIALAASGASHGTPLNIGGTLTAPTPGITYYKTEYINNNTFNNQASVNQGYLSRASGAIGDEVVFDFSSSQNLSQLASIVYFPHTESYYSQSPSDSTENWRYSSIGCSIQIYNDDTEIFSYELKSQKFAHRVDGPAIDSVPSNMFTTSGPYNNGNTNGEATTKIVRDLPYVPNPFDNSRLEPSIEVHRGLLEEVIYSSQIEETKDIYRYDGPAIKSSDMFSVVPSTTKIHDIKYGIMDIENNNPPTFQLWKDQQSNSYQYTTIRASSNNNDVNLTTNKNITDASNGQLSFYQGTSKALSSDFIEYELNNVYDYLDMESLVIYGTKRNKERIQNINVEIYDSNNDRFFESKITQNSDVYRFDGPAIGGATTDVLSTANIPESNDISFNEVRIKRTVGHDPFGISEVQVWKHVTNVSDFTFDRIRMERNTSNYLALSEIQVWVGGVNVAPQGININNTFEVLNYVTSLTPGEQQNKNLIDSNTNTLFTTSTLSENLSTNEFIQLRMANPVTYSQLQSIMFYNIDPAHSSTFNGAKFKLIDSSLNTFYEYVIEDSATANIYRFDGPAIKSWPYNYLSSNTVFNKVRLMRTTFTTSYGDSNRIHILELQVWKNNSNIMQSSVTLEASKTDTTYVVDNIKNGDFSDGNRYDSGINIIGDYVLVTFPESHNINDLQSVVIYNRQDQSKKFTGVSVQLMYDYNIIYSEEINTANIVYRVDGPAFSTVTGSMMSMEPSTTLIYNGHEVIDASTVTNGNINTTFSKVRVIRTGESGFNNSNEGNRLTIMEIQLWIENNGMVENVLSGIVSSDYTTIYSGFPITLATNGEFYLTNMWGYITANSASGTGTLGQYATFVLTTPRNIQDIASIVYGSVAHPTAGYDYNIGVSVQLLDDSDTVLYTYESLDSICKNYNRMTLSGGPCNIQRYDGPAINNVYESSFTNDLLTDNINILANKIVILDKAVKKLSPIISPTTNPIPQNYQNMLFSKQPSSTQIFASNYVDASYSCIRVPIPSFHISNIAIDPSVNVVTQTGVNPSRVVNNRFGLNSSTSQGFNIIRLERTSVNSILTGASTGYNSVVFDEVNNLVFDEVQVWIYENGVLKNIASSSNGGIVTNSSGIESPNERLNNERLNNETFGSSAFIANDEDTTNNIGKYFQVVLPKSILIDDLAAIVVYNREIWYYTNVVGVSIQVRNNDDILFSKEIKNGQRAWRIDGPLMPYDNTLFEGDLTASHTNFTLQGSLTNIIKTTTSDINASTNNYVHFGYLSNNGFSTQGFKNDSITISLNESITLSDLASIVVYPAGIIEADENKLQSMENMSIQLLENGSLKYEHEIIESLNNNSTLTHPDLISLPYNSYETYRPDNRLLSTVNYYGAYRFDGSGTLLPEYLTDEIDDITVHSYSSGLHRIIDGSNVQINSIVPSVSIVNTEDFVTGTLNVGVKKLQLTRSTASPNGFNDININELQFWVDVGGVPTNIMIDSSLNITSTSIFNDDSSYGITNMRNNNILDHDASGNIQMYRTRDVAGSELTIEFLYGTTEVYQYKDLTSLVIYNNQNSKEKMIGVAVKLIDLNNETFFNYIIDTSSNYYRFDNASKMTGYNEDYGYGGQSITNIIDDSYTFSFDKLRLTRLYDGTSDGGYNDLNFKEIQVWKQTGDSNDNYNVKNIRLQRTTPGFLSLNELQIWVGGQNVIGTYVTDSVQQITSLTIETQQQSNMIQGEFLTYFTTDQSYISSNEFIDISLNTAIQYSQIQSIVMYDLNYSQSFIDVRFQLLNSSGTNIYNEFFNLPPNVSINITSQSANINDISYNDTNDGFELVIIREPGDYILQAENVTIMHYLLIGGGGHGGGAAYSNSGDNWSASGGGGGGGIQVGTTSANGHINVTVGSAGLPQSQDIGIGGTGGKSSLTGDNILIEALGGGGGSGHHTLDGGNGASGGGGSGTLDTSAIFVNTGFKNGGSNLQTEGTYGTSGSTTSTLQYGGNGGSVTVIENNIYNTTITTNGGTRGYNSGTSSPTFEFDIFGDKGASNFLQAGAGGAGAPGYTQDQPTGVTQAPENGIVVLKYKKQSNINIQRYDGPAIDSYSNTFVTAPSTTQIFQSDFLDTSYNSYRVQMPSFDISNIAVSSTESYLVDNNNVDASSNYPTGQGSQLEVSLNETLSIDDLASIVMFNGDTTKGNNGISMQLLNSNNIQHTEIIDISNAHIATRLDGNATIDSKNYSQTGELDVALQRIIDTSNVQIFNTALSINKNNLSVTLNIWNPLNFIIYEDNRFVAVGDKVITESVDGITWNAQSYDLANFGKDQFWTGVTHGNSKFIVVANNFTPELDNEGNELATSDPRPKYSLNGITWNPYATGIEPSLGTWTSIAYGANMFVAVADGSQVPKPARVMYIQDTATAAAQGRWTVIQPDNNGVPGNAWQSIVYGADKFVAISNDNTLTDGSNNQIMYSSDGINWSTSGVTGVPDCSWNSIKYVNNAYVAVASSGTNRFMHSHDGLNWTSYPVFLNSWADITYSNGYDLTGKYVNHYVAVADTSNNTNILLNDAIIRNTIAIGNDTKAEFDNSIAIGKDATTNAPNQIVLGTQSEKVVVPGTVDISGNVTIHGNLSVNSVKMWSLVSSSGGSQTYRNTVAARLGSTAYIGLTSGSDNANHYWDIVHTKGGAVSSAWNSENGVFTFPEGGVYILNISIFVNEYLNTTNKLGRIRFVSLNGENIFNSGTSDYQYINFGQHGTYTEQNKTSSWVATPNALSMMIVQLQQSRIDNMNIFFDVGHTVLEIIKIA